jgi:predicted neuraminidase
MPESGGALLELQKSGARRRALIDASGEASHHISIETVNNTIACR